MRAVVCGTIFGQVYLEAFRRPDAPLPLAGVLARGSERSRLCAGRLGVPLYTSPAELPDDVAVACVVVRSGLLGGRGTELALSLMDRKIHVLQEHPLHHDELAQCLRSARRNGVVHHLNSFYVHLDPVRRFVGAARELLRRRPPLFIEAACGFQVAYALLDILGAVLGGVRPWQLTATTAGGPFRMLEGRIAGVPVTLRIQNQLDPADPDNFAHLMHRIQIGTEAGTLLLTDTHGPTLWLERPRFPREVRQDAAAPHFAQETSREDAVASVVTEAPPVGYAEAFHTLWPAGVARALAGLRRAIEDREEPSRHGQYHLALCQLWQDITSRLGPPELVRAGEPSRLTAADLQALVDAGRV
jgi:thiazolinyl imide reductase